MSWLGGLYELNNEESIKSRFVHLLWNSSYIFKETCPGWVGYMRSITKSGGQSKFYVTMLPIIDLNATDLTALYSLLLFVEKQSKNLNVAPPCVTFDQQLHVKAYLVTIP